MFLNPRKYFLNKPSRLKVNFPFCTSCQPMELFFTATTEYDLFTAKIIYFTILRGSFERG